MDSSLSLSKLLSQNGLAKEVEGEQAFHDLGVSQPVGPSLPLTFSLLPKRPLSQLSPLSILNLRYHTVRK